MKILFSGHHNPHFFTITEYLERAIEELGHELFVFEDRQHLFPGRIRKMMPFLDRIDLNFINQRMLAQAASTQPDMVVVTGGHRISSKTVKKIIDRGVTCILWTIDPPINFQPIIDAAESYEYIFCQGTEAIEQLDRAGIKGSQWLPMACDPLHHHPVEVSDRERKEFECDLAFVGSHYPNRARLLEGLAEFDLGIWGPGWDALPKESSLKRRIRGFHLPPDRWRKVYSLCKIVLVPHYQDLNRGTAVYQASPKIFEAMACGAFVISDNQRDVFKLFQKGNHLEVFYDLGDLRKKIQYYLNHPEERVKIARQGRQEVINHHTYLKRIEKLITIVAQNQRK